MANLFFSRSARMAAGISAAFLAVALSGAVAEDKPAAKAQVKQMTLRAVSPDKGRLIRSGMKLTTAGSPTVCCTNWNTSTGGTGCSSVEGECPIPQFKVECKADGCW